MKSIIGSYGFAAAYYGAALTAATKQTLNTTSQDPRDDVVDALLSNPDGESRQVRRARERTLMKHLRKGRR